MEPFFIRELSTIGVLLTSGFSWLAGVPESDGSSSPQMGSTLETTSKYNPVPWSSSSDCGSSFTTGSCFTATGNCFPEVDGCDAIVYNAKFNLPNHKKNEKFYPEI